ncbi:site-2 protease family protein [Myxococcaceae bacterium GXIMD 01537]
MESAPARTAQRPWLHLLLFVLTAGTTFVTYAVMFGGAPGRTFSEVFLGSVRLHGPDALAFSLSLLAILGSHEMGHYALARLHRVDTTLPYFIPLPFLGVGTLGAVIRIRDRIPNRNALVDIGAAGPLAGLVVAVPLLYWGLTHSVVVDVPAGQGSTWLGDNSLWGLGREAFAWLMARLTHAPPAPEVPPAGPGGLIFGDNLLMVGLTRLALGPLPPGKDVLMHPVVVAGWFGLLVTLLNLLPVGQLDGGHLTFALWGRHARWVGRGVALVLLFLSLFVTATWVMWLLVTSKLVGFGHPEVLDPAVPLTRGRKWICALAFLALVGCAMPIPLRQVVS